MTGRDVRKMKGILIEWIAKTRNGENAKGNKSLVSSSGRSVSHCPFSFRDFALSRFRDSIPFMGVVPLLTTPFVP